MSSLLELVDGYSPDWNQIQQIIMQSNSNDVIQQPIDDNGRYLLHYACWKKAPSELVIQLIYDYPTACEMKDHGGSLPLHVACVFGNQSESVIQLLIKQYPQACEIPTTKYGSYPLHIACQLNASLSVLQLLVQQCPEALTITDNDNKTPLDRVKERNDDPKIIELLESYLPPPSPTTTTTTTCTVTIK